ncbi:hypothetical protein BRADI_1g56575v3 [Brachypodium distachyon]|uniref:Uncharacterized protein n=1 Tax=Brachypodium distachyon TaxID=15368 RepID=A0A2K2DRS3_BRADI|nr:hypothetical protein BRADI_1g56575v3 [Brachypodium distachyon]
MAAAGSGGVVGEECCSAGRKIQQGDGGEIRGPSASFPRYLRCPLAVLGARARRATCALRRDFAKLLGADFEFVSLLRPLTSSTSLISWSSLTR